MTDIFGVQVEELPDGWTPLEVIAVVKCIDEDGCIRLLSTYSDGLNGWEAVGMLDLEHEHQRSRLVRSMRGDDL